MAFPLKCRHGFLGYRPTAWMSAASSRIMAGAGVIVLTSRTRAIPAASRLAYDHGQIGWRLTENDPGQHGWSGSNQRENHSLLTYHADGRETAGFIPVLVLVHADMVDVYAPFEVVVAAEAWDEAGAKHVAPRAGCDHWKLPLLVGVCNPEGQQLDGGDEAEIFLGKPFQRSTGRDLEIEVNELDFDLLLPLSRLRKALVGDLVVHKIVTAGGE